jgi:hypothetical protein
VGARSRTTFKKRQKELARLEKRRDKAARMMQRKQEKAAGIQPADDLLDAPDATPESPGEAGVGSDTVPDPVR